MPQTQERRGRVRWGLARTAARGELELVPEELVVNFVVELHFLRLDDRAEEARAAVRGRLLEVGVAGFDVIAQTAS